MQIFPINKLVEGTKLSTKTELHWRKKIRGIAYRLHQKIGSSTSEASHHATTADLKLNNAKK
ncbi:hypothetical protein GCM10009119_23710 [Algoriphagus jejuensis]|uniref:Uncharacterized protein n=1 Tax=Algoriphagus jejuensis TaxID=419934 RepID=A0ABN1N1E4_9BACT